MPRKTITVSEVLELANNHLERDNSTPDGREAVCELIESVLFSAGHYDSGYRYLETSEIDGNGTRRRYYMKGNG